MFNRLGAALTWTRNFILNLIFVLIVAVVVVWIFAGQGRVPIAERSALVLNPTGILVEQATIGVPFQDLLLDGSRNAETVIGDVVEAIDRAAADERIQLLVLDLDNLAGASSADAETLKPAFARFRAKDKPIIAYGNLYSQAQYLIASYADHVYLHPLGQLLLSGFGSQHLYYKDLLDKLKVNVHVFRVGDYKSAVEPYTRNTMSEEARQANRVLVEGLWGSYASEVATNRSLTTEQVNAYANNFQVILQQTGGDLARAALEGGLVDELLTRDQIQARLADLVGTDARGDFNSVDLHAYLAGSDSAEQSADRKIAVIVASGMLMNGESLPGVAGADTLIEQLRTARQQDDVAAVVIRIDSPGGSVFASEMVRKELELVQLAGKTVVASMGGVAASGGYWIAATSDRIVAQPSTITGSIGIFGIVPTFEASLASLGIATDGVTTSPLGASDALSGLGEEMAQILQASVENGYERFINTVARGRDMAPEEVHKIAQGRVWIGSQAADLGLVDELGDLAHAIEVAAALANLDKYQVKRYQPEQSPQDRLLRQLIEGQSMASGSRSQLLIAFDHLLSVFDRFDDPMNVYALCEVCSTPFLH